MKITCQSCQAKYTIADEKVAGKTVKIKCKKCGATIVVSGADGAAAAPFGAPAPAPMAAPAMGAPMAAAPPAAGDDDDGEGATRVFSEGGGAVGPDEWTVNVTDDDQRTLTSAQIVMEYQRGTVRADTYVWKDGMADWLPISDVPELMRLVSTPKPAAGFSAPRPAAGMPAAGAPMAAAPMAAAPVPVEPDLGPGGLGGTVIMNEGAPIGGGPSPAGPAAARRAGKPSGGVDLFASGQHEMSPAAPMASSHDRQVGERNENSVLFSISALTASAGASKRNDDPFDLAAPSPPRNNGRQNVDDIMNLGAGIGGAPMLAPPPLLAPVVEAPPPPPPQPMPVAAPVAPAMSAVPAMRADQFAPPPAKSKAPLIVGVVVGVLALGGVGAFFAFKPSSTPPSGGAEAANTVAAAAATTAPADKPTLNGAAPTATPTPADNAKPAETAAAQAPTAPTATPGGSHEPAAHESGHPASGGPAGHAAESKPEKPEAKPEKPADDKPAKPADDKPAKPADSKPADTGGAGGKEFDRGAAMAALSGASGAARGCKKDDGPTGTAHVRITFAPSGSVTSSSVDGAFAGTSVGACIAAAFKGAHVPAFDGSSVTVTKSISIN